MLLLQERTTCPRHETAHPAVRDLAVETDVTRRSIPSRIAFRPATKGTAKKRLRDWLRQQGIEPVIPHKDNEKARHDPAVTFDRQTYRQRHVVEQCVGWLKECRLIGTRFEKLAVSFHAMLQLAMIRIP